MRLFMSQCHDVSVHGSVFHDVSVHGSVRERLGASLFVCLFSCCSCRMATLLLYHSVAPCASKGGISGSASLSSLGVILRNMSIYRRK